MKKVMSTCPGLNLVQSIFSCLAALTNPGPEVIKHFFHAQHN